MKTTGTVAGLILSCVVLSVQSGDIQEGSVEYVDGVYKVHFDAMIAAPQPLVYQLMTDYAHLSYLSDSILESTVIQRVNSSQHKTRLLLHTCILFFCQKMILIEDVQANGTDQIVATVVPENSDFKSGMSHWRIQSFENLQTRLTLNRRLEPDFWVPPVIGPWLIRKKMLQELSVMIERLEYYANQYPRG